MRNAINNLFGLLALVFCGIVLSGCAKPDIGECAQRLDRKGMSANAIADVCFYEVK